MTVIHAVHTMQSRALLCSQPGWGRVDLWQHPSAATRQAAEQQATAPNAAAGGRPASPYASGAAGQAQAGALRAHLPLLWRRVQCGWPLRVCMRPHVKCSPFAPALAARVAASWLLGYWPLHNTLLRIIHVLVWISCALCILRHQRMATVPTISAGCWLNV
jgi:hypothetical protein